MQNKGNSHITLIALILSIMALVVASASYLNSDTGFDEEDFSAKLEAGIESYIQKQKTGNGAKVERIKVSVDDDAVKGIKNAPVTIVEFSDYECPFCARFYQNTWPKIVSEYIDTGKVKLVYRDFPLGFHRTAKKAAIAAECVRDELGDKAYFKYHNAIYENQKNLNIDNLKLWAKNLGANEAQFNSCLDNDQYAAEVENDIKDGKSYGVTGAPTFFINGIRLSGAKSFEDFKEIIEKELQ